MKHESIVVVYDSSLHGQSDQRPSGQAIAEEIADKLGFVLAFTGVALLIRYYNHKA
jgi:hypothetical protein